MLRFRRTLISQQDLAVLEVLDMSPCEFSKRASLVYDQPNEVRVLRACLVLNAAVSELSADDCL